MRFTEIRSSFQNQNAAQALVARWTLLGLALLGAMVVAYWIGTQRVVWLFLCVAVAVVAWVTTGVRQRAWVLIPLGWILSGNTQLLPIPFSIRDMTVLLGTGAYVGYRILSHKHTRFQTHALDWLVVINLAYLVITYIRHPVGFRAIGSEQIGGRPYLNVFIATLAYWVLVRLPESTKTVSRIPYFLLAGSTLITILHVVAYIAPSTTPMLYFLYSGLDLDLYLGPGRELAASRLKGLSYLGAALIPLLCAYYPPQTLFNPLRPRFYAMMLGLTSILLSGFRSSMLWAFVAIGLGSWLHRGWRELAAGVVAGALVLGALLIGQGRLYELPFAAQRTLSFLPGKWSEAAVSDAVASSEGRFAWWKTVIRHDLINDWWFGDGFGISQSDFTTLGRSGRYTEDVLMTGAYHNGPLSSIRYAGIVGMLLFYVLMIGCAIYAYRCVQQCRGTPLFPVAVFLAIYLLWQPFHFTFVFGGYEGVSEYIFYTGLLRLVTLMSERSRAQEAAKPATSPSRLQPAASRLSP